MNEIVEPTLQCHTCGYERECCVCDNRNWCSYCQDYHTTSCPHEEDDESLQDWWDSTYPEEPEID